ncbi:hypothetical protein [Candidatus Regiella endosymbiont of Tuberolachnus salignus]|uniref:hypothetical protein n=1 Tax=Candidatus Regiella endosymbiont of Tuberolachnus salignus TaxID=3077956 RepID=UPI0030CB3486
MPTGITSLSSSSFEKTSVSACSTPAVASKVQKALIAVKQAPNAVTELQKKYRQGLHNNVLYFHESPNLTPRELYYVNRLHKEGKISQTHFDLMFKNKKIFESTSNFLQELKNMKASDNLYLQKLQNSGRISNDDAKEAYNNPEKIDEIKASEAEKESVAQQDREEHIKQQIEARQQRVTQRLAEEKKLAKQI